MRWDFFVRHYTSEALQEKDPKYVRDYRGVPVNGILYPRAGTLGGCTAHNAMIRVYPHNADWDGIASLTGDASWNAEAMRRYFEKFETGELPSSRTRALARKVGPNPSRHAGTAGCRLRKRSRPAIADHRLVEVLLDSAATAFDDIGQPIRRLLNI